MSNQDVTGCTCGVRTESSPKATIGVAEVLEEVAELLKNKGYCNPLESYTNGTTEAILHFEHHGKGYSMKIVPNTLYDDKLVKVLVNNHQVTKTLAANIKDSEARVIVKEYLGVIKSSEDNSVWECCYQGHHTTYNGKDTNEWLTVFGDRVYISDEE